VGRCRLVVWVCGLIAAAVLLLPATSLAINLPPPEPDLTCSYSGPPSNTATFTAGTGEDTLVLKRVGDEINLFSETQIGHVVGKGKRKRVRWHTELSGPTCNATPTVHNTDAIDVVVNAEEDIDLEVSLDGGPLAPGATPEADGTPEIETRLESLDPGQRVIFVGGPEADWFRFGANNGVQGVNLNAQDEPISPDEDVTMTLAPPSQPADSDWPGAEARLGAGNDTLTTDGGPEFGSPLEGAVIAMGGSGDDSMSSSSPRFTGLNGGPGNDVISGGPKYNIIRAGKGNDVVTGGRGQDLVELGKGHDFANTGPGNDGIAAFDHTRDRVLCGGGRDGVARDPADRVPGCEVRVVRHVGIQIFTD
jgi:Ca2+-binding RTX toxin-like protein